MMPSIVPLFLAVVCLSISGSFASQPEVIFSSNATMVQIGASLKLKCQLGNFAPGNELYQVLFYTDEGYFAYYLITAVDSTGHRSTTFYNDTIHYHSPSLGRQPLSSTFPVYEITVTPTVAKSNEYWCNLWQATPPIDVFSKRLSITAKPSSQL